MKNTNVEAGESYVLWELETTSPAAVIPICEYFRVIDGKLVEVRPHYDPRPITNPG